MINKFLYIIRLLIKYKNPDAVLGFGRFLASTGLFLLGSGAAWQLAISTELFTLPVEISFGPTDTVSPGLILLAIGTILGLWRINTLSQKITGLLVMHRGMEGMEISHAKRAVPSSYGNGRFDVIDLREGHRLYQGSTESPERALRTILDLPLQITTRLSGENPSHVNLAYAGLAPIPLLIAAGYVVTSRQPCLVLDYDRTEGWHSLDAPDDDEQIKIVDAESMVSESIAIAISFSAAISESQLPEEFRRRTYYLELENGPRVDSLPSEEKQKRIVKVIYSFLANLKKRHQNLSHIHLYIAAQASFCFRLGTIISMSVHPPITTYQYEPSFGTYCWGICIKPGEEPRVAHVT